MDGERRCPKERASSLEATTNTTGKKAGGREAGGRIAAGFPGPGAHFLSSPWLRRMISAELAILADTGSNSARCPLWGAHGTVSFLLHPKRANTHPPGVLNEKESRSSKDTDRAPSRADRRV